MSTKYLMQTLLPNKEIDIRVHDLTVDGSLNAPSTALPDPLEVNNLIVNIHADLQDVSVGLNVDCVGGLAGATVTASNYVQSVNYFILGQTYYNVQNVVQTGGITNAVDCNPDAKHRIRLTTVNAVTPAGGNFDQFQLLNDNIETNSVVTAVLQVYSDVGFSSTPYLWVRNVTTGSCTIGIQNMSSGLPLNGYVEMVITIDGSI